MEADRVATEQELEKTGAERVQVSAAVSPSVLALFERVSKHRRGLAMSEARDGLCTQCHVRLRPQVYNELRRNESVMQCESCSRILYFLATPVDSSSPTPETRSAPAEPGT
jgi:predicted  nucleic acid-binding Zn-ribbon protein